MNVATLRKLVDAASADAIVQIKSGPGQPLREVKTIILKDGFLLLSAKDE